MIRAIFYSEFDNSLGPRVLFDAPDGSVSRAAEMPWMNQQQLPAEEDEEHRPEMTPLFEAISDYSITGPQLSGHLITVLVPALGMLASPGTVSDDVQVVNFPIAISGSKYGRNALLFNVGLVLYKHAPAQLFTAALRKLSLMLRSMELESEFLSTPSKKAALSLLLPRLLQDLNASGECTLPLDSRNFLSLKLPAPADVLLPTADGSNNRSKRISDKQAEYCRTRHSSHPGGSWYLAHAMANQRLIPEVKEHHVPCLLVDPTQIQNIDWDITVQKIIYFIDGVKCAKEIALESKVDSNLCRASLRVLLWHGCLVLVDIFRYSNIYALRDGVAGLFQAGPLRHEQWMDDFLQNNSRSGENAITIQNPWRFLAEAVTLQYKESSKSAMGDDLGLNVDENESFATNAPDGPSGGDVNVSLENQWRDGASVNTNDNTLSSSEYGHEWWTEQVLSEITVMPIRRHLWNLEQRKHAEEKRHEFEQKTESQTMNKESGSSCSIRNERHEYMEENTMIDSDDGVHIPADSNDDSIQSRSDGEQQGQKSYDFPRPTKSLDNSTELPSSSAEHWVIPVGSMLKEALQYSTEAVHMSSLSTESLSLTKPLPSEAHSPLSSRPRQPQDTMETTALPISVSPHSGYRVGCSYTSVGSGESGQAGENDADSMPHQEHQPSSSSYSSSLSSSTSNYVLRQAKSSVHLRQKMVQHPLRTNSLAASNLSRSAPKPPLARGHHSMNQRWQQHQNTPPSPQLRSHYATNRQSPQLMQRQRIQGPPAGPVDVLDFFCAFGSGESVRNIVLKQNEMRKPDGSIKKPNSKRSIASMDYRRLVAFGILHGILQRIHVFPICEIPKSRLNDILSDVKKLLTSSNTGGPSGVGTVNNISKSGNGILKDLIGPVIKRMDGRNSMDVICTEFFITEKRVRHLAELLSEVQPPGSPSVVYIYK